MVEENTPTIEVSLESIIRHTWLSYFAFRAWEVVRYLCKVLVGSAMLLSSIQYLDRVNFLKLSAGKHPPRSLYRSTLLFTLGCVLYLEVFIVWDCQFRVLLSLVVRRVMEIQPIPGTPWWSYHMLCVILLHGTETVQVWCVLMVRKYPARESPLLSRQI